MYKKRILIIGMFDSIHIARWIKQFENTGFKIILFPSTHFRFPHPQLFEIEQPKIRVIGLSVFGKLLGYVDSFLTLRFLNKRVALMLRRLYLKFTIFLIRPDITHAIEIQHAGYLVSNITGSSRRRILTNWGSDIYFFQHRPEHIEKIKRSLEWATDYSAECARDYELAEQFGFRGRNLPRIPNAGGFEAFASQSKCSERNLILVKSYGGVFGAGKIAIDSIRLFLEEGHKFEIYFYSVTQDLLSDIQSLAQKYPSVIRYSTLEKSIPHDELIKLFNHSRIYLGCSYSDGLSTSFLQALCTGAFPIQTNTSCAGELLSEGAAGKIVAADKAEILSAIKEIIYNDDALDNAQAQNIEYSKIRLNSIEISKLAQTFYLS